MSALTTSTDILRHWQKKGTPRYTSSPHSKVYVWKKLRLGKKGHGKESWEKRWIPEIS